MREDCCLLARVAAVPLGLSGMKNLLRQWTLGTSLRNEYVCLVKGALSNPLNVYLKLDRESFDVTEAQVLLSYQPLVIGLALADARIISRLNGQSLVRFSFQAAAGEEVAWLELKRLKEWRIGETDMILYTGQRGKHKFLSNFYQLMNRGHQLLRSFKPRDGALSAGLYDQVRIAYASPRSVSVISVGDGDLCNMFPTDLHGAMGEKFYVGALRIGGKACDQVEKHKRIVISKVSASSFKETYALGKNHMSGLKEASRLDTLGVSEMWKLPLPRSVVSYKELDWKSSFDVGLHRIHFYDVVNIKTVHPEKPALTHIHAFYAQWRMNRGLGGEYFLR